MKRASPSSAAATATPVMKRRRTNSARSQNGTFAGDSSYQRLLFGAHYQISRLEAVCMTLSLEHQALLQLKDSTRASITATEADIHALQGHLRSARKKRSSAEIYDGMFARACVRRVLGRGGHLVRCLMYALIVFDQGSRSRCWRCLSVLSAADELPKQCKK